MGVEASVSLCLDALFPVDALLDACSAFAKEFPAVDLRVDTQLMSAVSARVLDGSATLGVVYLGLFPTAIAFATWAYALNRMSAGSLSSSSYLVPGIAVLLSWLLLGEVPAPLAFTGGALCLLGVAVTRLTPSPLLHILGNKSGPRSSL